MKRTALLLKAGLLSVIVALVVACEKEPQPGGGTVTPPVVVTPTVTLNISATNIVFADSVEFSWTTTNCSDVYLDGKLVGASGTLKTKRLFETTTFVLRGVGASSSNTATDQKSVSVGDWKTSTYGLINHQNIGWKIDTVMVMKADTIFCGVQRYPDEKDDTYFFNLDGTAKMVTIYGSSTGTWKIDKNVFYMSTKKLKLVNVNEKELILDLETDWSGPAVIRTKYK